MGFAEIRSVGAGSSNAISLDTVDKLREAEQSAVIKPIDKNLERNKAKNETLDVLITQLQGLKASTSTLSDDSLYMKRSVSTTTDAFSVSADNGVKAQTFSLNVKQLASEDIIQSNTFSSRSESIGKKDSSITIKVGDSEHKIELDDTTTLEQLMQKINDKDIGISASILNTGENEYRLILKGKTLGDDGAISISESDGLDIGLSKDENHVQTAQNALFNYNGIEISRSSNTVKDLIYGVKIELQDTTIKAESVTVSENIDSIMEEMQNFISSYNSLQSSLNEATKFDEETKKSGAFQGDSNVTSITRELNRLILSSDKDSNTLTKYGISLNKLGNLEFDSSVFEQEFKKDSQGVQDFFKGTDSNLNGKRVHNGGVFYKLNHVLDQFVGSKGRLNYLQQSISNQGKSLQEEREKSISLLDSKYEMLANRYASYDSMIGQLTSGFQSLQMQIETQMNGGNK
jgi:flagellar hook-associated protein 2